MSLICRGTRAGVIVGAVAGAAVAAILGVVGGCSGGEGIDFFNFFVALLGYPTSAVSSRVFGALGANHPALGGSILAFVAYACTVPINWAGIGGVFGLLIDVVRMWKHHPN